MRRTCGRGSRRRFLIPLLVAGCAAAPSPAASAQEQIYKWFGDQPQEYFGGGLAVGGDLTGDGVPDILVGANQASNGVGSVRAFSGSDGSIAWTMFGGAGDFLGGDLAFLGDVDHDGISDFVGASWNAPGSLNLGGAVTLYSGATRAPIYTILGAAAGERFGTDIEPMGDLDGDGTTDVAVAENAFADVQVFSGANGALLYTIPTPAYGALFGEALASGGDVDGDGAWDLVIGDKWAHPTGAQTGAAFVYSGKSGAFLYELDGASQDDDFGDGVAIVHDLDRDGLADLLIGASGETDGWNYGVGHVHSGRNGSSVMSIGPLYLSFAAEVADAGDMNRDGFGDLVIVQGWGGERNNPYDLRAIVHLFSGRDGSHLYHYLDPYSVGDGFASALKIAPDLDRDGSAELAFGTPWDDDGSQKFAGSASVWRGDDFFVDAVPTMPYSGGPITLDVGQGVANAPYVLFLAEVLTSPANLLLAWGSLDATGHAILSGNLPFGLRGYTLGFKAYSLDANSKVVDSGIETIYIE
jgi:hypothetical protein